MHRSRKVLIVGLLAAGTFGVVAASAATLGTLNSSTVGSSDQTVASCTGGGATLAYSTAFNGTSGSFDVNGVTVTGLATPACNGKAITVVLKNTSSGTASTTATFAGTVSSTGSATLTGATIPAATLQGVSVVVTG